VRRLRPPDPRNVPDPYGIPKSKELRRGTSLRRLRNVNDWGEKPFVSSMFVQAGGALAIKEAASPGEFLAHRTGADDRRQPNAEGPLELSSFDWAEPRCDPFDYASQVGSRCRLPVVERLPSVDEDRSFDPPDADDPPELGQYFRDSIRTGLVDPRLDTTAAPIGPALAVEESSGPSKVVALQPRDLDRNMRACMSPKRAELSHVLTTSRRTNVRGLVCDGRGPANARKPRGRAFLPGPCANSKESTRHARDCHPPPPPPPPPLTG